MPGRVEGHRIFRSVEGLVIGEEDRVGVLEVIPQQGGRVGGENRAVMASGMV